MQYFVTGATGFVGGRVAAHLLDAGHDVTVLARTPADAADLEAAGATVVQGDITKPATLRAPMRGVDGVFHVAGWYRVGVDDPAVAESVNVDGTRNVMELVDELDIPKAVYTSTLAINSDTGGRLVDEAHAYQGDHLTFYEATKWRAHHEVVAPMVADGLPVVTVMPGAVYGPGDTSQLGSVLRDYLTGDLPFIPEDVAYSWGHVDDIARGHVLAMAKGEPGEEYMISGERATLEAFLELAKEHTGIPTPRTVPPWVFARLARVTGVINRFVDVPTALHPEMLRSLAGVTYLGDNAKATMRLGLRHRSLREGILETIRDELDQLGDRALAVDLPPAGSGGQTARPADDSATDPDDATSSESPTDLADVGPSVEAS